MPCTGGPACWNTKKVARAVLLDNEVTVVSAGKLGMPGPLPHHNLGLCFGWGHNKINALVDACLNHPWQRVNGVRMHRFPKELVLRTRTLPRVLFFHTGRSGCGGTAPTLSAGPACLRCRTIVPHSALSIHAFTVRSWAVENNCEHSGPPSPLLEKPQLAPK